MGAIAAAVYFVAHISSFHSFVDDIIYAGRDGNDLDSISSGRGTQIEEAWEVFSQNIFLGVGVRKTTDMFYVSALTNYGLLSWPLLIMAIYPIIWSIYNLKNGDIYDVTFFIIALSIFLISLLEELAPFGPGTRCYILWLMWGILLSNKKRKKQDAKYRARGVAKSFIRSA